jgi:hypothetical protein
LATVTHASAAVVQPVAPELEWGPRDLDLHERPGAEVHHPDVRVPRADLGITELRVERFRHVVRGGIADDDLRVGDGPQRPDGAFGYGGLRQLGLAALGHPHPVDADVRLENDLPLAGKPRTQTAYLCDRLLGAGDDFGFCGGSGTAQQGNAGHGEAPNRTDGPLLGVPVPVSFHGDQPGLGCKESSGRKQPEMAPLK